MASGLGRTEANKRKTNAADGDNQDEEPGAEPDGEDSDGERQRARIPKKKKRVCSLGCIKCDAY